VNICGAGYMRKSIHYLYDGPKRETVAGTDKRREFWNCGNGDAVSFWLVVSACAGVNVSSRFSTSVPTRTNMKSLCIHISTK
jgi:hypothetical protein